MAKYAVEYVEKYRKIYLVEADSYDDAVEKMEDAAENVGNLIDLADDFDYWEVLSTLRGENPVPEEEQCFYDTLKESN